MVQRAQDQPFGVMLLAFCLALVQAAVAVTGRQPALWALAALDLVLAVGLWLLQPWARWLTLARCALILGALVPRMVAGGIASISWPPVAVALFGLVYLALPATGRAFRRGDPSGTG